MFRSRYLLCMTPLILVPAIGSSACHAKPGSETGAGTRAPATGSSKNPMEVTEDAEKSILQERRKWLTVNESEIMTIQWVSDPHYLKSENLILLDVEVKPDILKALGNILGAQFAGMKSA